MAMPNIPPELAQALMSNPELMSLLMKPGLMQKLQSNPESARNDPDMQRVMQIMQDTGLINQFQQFAGNNGGMGGMMGGGGGGASSSSAGGSGELVEVKSESHFEELMKTTPADKLVVVDYYATWCGPCKRIAPTYKELAKTYRNSVVCLKVNVDTTQPLATNKGIRSMPTFQFYRGGRLLDEMKGANDRQLESLVAKFSEGPKKREKPNPYRHFPARDNELVSFTKVKYDPIVKNIKKYSAEEKEACSLSSDELSSLDSIVSTLQDTGSYHNSKFSEEEYKLVSKLLSWPAARLPPVINLVRVLVWHPDASKHYATEDLLSKMSVFVAAHEENANNALAALRTILNMFSRHALSSVLLANHEQVVSGISSAMSSTNKNVRLTCASILLNLSIKFRKDNEQYAEGKILVASSLVEALSNEQDVAVAYRLLVAFGTLCFRDEATIAVASSLDDTLIETLLGRFPAGGEPAGTVQNLRACCDELTKALADPSA